MKAVVLAGGTGSRLRPFTYARPKQLLPVAGTPVLDYVLSDIADAGIHDVGLVHHPGDRDAFEGYVGDGGDWGVDVSYVEQPEPLGLADAVARAREFVGEERFLVYLGDNVVRPGVADFLAALDTGDWEVGLAVAAVEEPSRFGVVECDDDGRVRQVVEKPDDPPSNQALVGVYAFTPRVFDAIERIEPSDRGELELTDAIRTLLAADCAVEPYRLSGWWADVGTPADLLHANAALLERGVPRSLGRPAAGDAASVADGATVREPVALGANATVGPDAVVGPNVTVGPRCEIAAGRVVDSVVLADTVIDVNATVADSVLGPGATLDAATDGSHALLAGPDTDIDL